MDWRGIAFDWNHARAFLVTAEEGSLSAAARALGLTQPTLGRQVEALQQQLGVVLFERAGKGLVLTPSGRDLLDHVRQMAEDARRFSVAAQGRSQELEGLITITASEVYSAYLLPQVVERIRREAPGITVEIVSTNERVDLMRREADIAIRNFRSEQPELIARRLKDDTGYLYATPSYLTRIGNPRSAADLEGADFVGFDHTDMMINALKGFGLNLTQKNFPLVTASHIVQWELVKRGIAIGVMTTEVGEREPLVRRVLEDMAPISIPVWLTTHREVGMSRRVRFVFDLMADELSSVRL